MSIRRLFFLCSIIFGSMSQGCLARADDGKILANNVLAAFVAGKDHIQELDDLRARSVDFPSVVATLTDYKIFEHGGLIDLVLGEGGEELVPALRAKLRTDIDCSPEFISICQPSLADRNEEILRAMDYLRRRQQQ